MRLWDVENKLGIALNTDEIAKVRAFIKENRIKENWCSAIHTRSDLCVDEKGYEHIKKILEQ